MFSLQKPSEAQSEDSHRLSLLSDRTVRRYQRHSSSENTNSQSIRQRPDDDAWNHPYESLPSLHNGQTSYDAHASHADIPSHVEKRPQGWRPVLHFIWHSPLMLSALVVGSAGALACFAFTYWLASQLFYCPSWAINCELNSSAHYLAKRLGLVQGILSTVYGICVAGVVYGSYELAEATLWPLLCNHGLSTKGIDRFVAHTRGSLASFPYAFWHTRHHVSFLVTLKYMQ